MNTPISILTGFLGSGKTTLLRHLLTSGLAGRRVAIIVNEIGEIGIDGRVIGGLNVERMIELSNGCICCSASPEFVLAVEEIVATVAPELIMIETTGLADPWSLVQQVRGADYLLDSIVAVVDAANFEAALALSDIVRWQIEAADFLVLNKVDLVDASSLALSHSRLRTLNERAVIFETTQGALPVEIFLTPELLADAARREAGHSSANHLDREGFSSFVLRGSRPLDRKRFEAFLAALPPQIYRAKGFVHCTDATWPTLFQHVAGRLQYEWTRFRQEPPQLVEAVFIGKGALALREQIAEGLRECEAPDEEHARWRQIQALRLGE
jgi:G3E family GTPase